MLVNEYCFLEHFLLAYFSRLRWPLQQVFVADSVTGWQECARQVTLAGPQTAGNGLSLLFLAAWR